MVGGEVEATEIGLKQADGVVLLDHNAVCREFLFYTIKSKSII